MRPFITACYFLLVSAAAAQTYPYALKTIAGSSPSGDGGPAATALLDGPQAVAVDSTGQVFIAQGNSGGIRKVDKNGNISTFYAGIVAYDIKVDAAGNVYASDDFDTVYKITPAGKISTFAGGSYGFGGDGNLAANASLGSPEGLAIDNAGNVYIADSDNCRIRKVTTDGKIQTVAGSGKCVQFFSSSSGLNVSNGTQASTAPLQYPDAVAVDQAGNLYIADEAVVQKVTTNGIISQLAGYPGASLNNGPAISAYIGGANSLATDSAGNLYVTDQYLSLLRMISPSGQIATVAGTLNLGAPVYAYSGDGGPGVSASLFYPLDVAVDANNVVYVADQGNARVRKINQSGTITTFAGASHFGGDGGPAANALLYTPYDTTFDAGGNLYVSDYDNHRIRKIAPSGVISTVAGNGTCAYSGDGGQATAASLCFPTGIRFDPSGNLLIADTFNHVVRKVNLSGFISTLAGTGTEADKGDGGLASAANFVSPFGLAVDSVGNVYVSDQAADRVRKITPNGNISTVAGNGTPGYTGDGGLATAAKLDSPGLLAVDANNNLYIADQGNNRVRELASGVISTVAGAACCATGSKANGAYIGTPEGVGVDAAGNLFITSSDLGLIFKVPTDGTISVIAGNGNFGFSGDGLASANSLSGPSGVAIDKAGDVYFADRFNERIRVLQPDAPTGLKITSGDGQTGTGGAALAQPLIVQLSFQAGIPVAGAPVTFVIASGQGSLSATTTNTDQNGQAGVTLTLGAAGGPVTVTATAGTFSVTFHATGAPATPVPTISAGGVQGAGGSTPAVATLSPGGFASVFGSNFAPAGTARAVQASDFVNGALPTNLANTCVQVGGVNAFLSYVSPSQINFQAPAITTGQPASVVVINGCGTASPVSSAPVSVATADATPEFLYWVRNPTGQNPVVAVNTVTFGYVGAAGLIPGATFTPAKPGDYLTIYAISFGATNPPVAPGVGAAAAATIPAATVTLGSSALPAANVLYVGASPGSPGLYQVNIQVPALPDGDYPISVGLGSFSTPAGGYLTVKN